MLVIACVNVGTAFDDEYVHQLKWQVGANLSLSHRFVCLSDHDIPGVDTIRVPADYGGWWNKLHLFDGHLLPPGDQVFYLDLDTAVVGDIAEIVGRNRHFSMLSDFYHPRKLASGLMSFTSGQHDRIKDDWLAYGAPRLAGGDQVWISLNRPDSTRLNDLYEGQIRSYKVDCKDEVPDDTRIVCFHGKPRPHEAGGWIADLWSRRLK